MHSTHINISHIIYGQRTSYKYVASLAYMVHIL